MERKGKWTRGPMTYNGNEVVRVDEPNGGVAGAWRDEDALFVMSAFNAATTCEDMGYDGEACLKMLPELMAFVFAKYFDHYNSCDRCQHGVCAVGNGYERILAKCRG